MKHWYENKKNIIELAEFLVESKEFTTTKELLDYFKHPENFTEVWNTYQEEVLGKLHQSDIGPFCKYKEVPRLVALVHPSAQCE